MYCTDNMPTSDQPHGFTAKTLYCVLDLWLMKCLCLSAEAVVLSTVRQN